MNQIAVSMDAYPYAKYQHHSSIQSWHIHIEDAISKLTFGMPWYV